MNFISGKKGCSKNIWKNWQNKFCWDPIILEHLPQLWSSLDLLSASFAGICFEQKKGLCHHVLDCWSENIITFLLQMMFIIAWEGISLLDIFQKEVLYKLSSIFITAAILRLLQSMIHWLKFLCIIYHTINQNH